MGFPIWVDTGRRVLGRVRCGAGLQRGDSSNSVMPMTMRPVSEGMEKGGRNSNSNPPEKPCAAARPGLHHLHGREPAVGVSDSQLAGGVISPCPEGTVLLHHEGEANRTAIRSLTESRDDLLHGGRGRVGLQLVEPVEERGHVLAVHAHHAAVRAVRVAGGDARASQPADVVGVRGGRRDVAERHGVRVCGRSG